MFVAVPEHEVTVTQVSAKGRLFYTVKGRLSTFLPLNPVVLV